MRTFFAAPALVLTLAAGALAETNDSPMIQCAPGWRAEIVAQAPDIRAPSVVCCAPDGRIFLGQDVMDMGSPTDQPGDSILCIFPDGHITVFATNLYAVFGLQYHDGKLYVHHSPKFSVFDDDNGVGTNRVDLIASDNPHPWLPSLNDHIPSGFHLAMDGYFYISTGDKGIYGATGTDGRKIEMRGGIYRMRPDGTGLEVYCTGTRNHLDIAINDEDEMFTYDNTDDGGGWWTRLTHMVDGGFYGYPYDFKPRRPYTLWMMTDFGGQSGAPTCALAYNEDALPAEYRGDLFLCDWSAAAVLRVKVKKTGGAYEVVSREQDQGQDFITRGGFGIYFRPVGICVTPDGMGFYITDWALSGWKKPDVIGRLFKVIYTGKSLAAQKPDWYVPAASGQKFNASTDDLIRALSHPAQSVRLVAQRRLAERRGEAAEKLAALLADQHAPPYARWSAIWTLDAMDGGRAQRQSILSALHDPDATVQAQAARQLGTHAAPEAVGPLVQMLDSTNNALRFRAATALGRIGDADAVAPLQQALKRTDLFSRYAAFLALRRIGQSSSDAWPEIAGGFTNSDAAIREGTFFAMRETYDAGLVRALGDLLSSKEISLDSRTNVLGLLASLYQKPPPWNGDWWNATPVYAAPPAKTAEWEGSSVAGATLCVALASGDPAVRQIAFDWSRTSRDTNASAVLRELFARDSTVAGQAAILRALPATNDPSARALLGPILKNPQSPPELLEAAIEDAQRSGESEWNADLIRLAEHPPNDEILIQLFQVFGSSKLAETAPLLSKYLVNTNLTLRAGAAAALVQIGGDAAANQLLPGLQDPAVEIRRQSIEALGAMRAKSAVAQLIRLSSDSELSVPAIQALARIQDLAALDVYLDGLASKDSMLRLQCRAAVTALADAALPPIESKLAPSNRLPDDTLASLKEIYRTNSAARKGPLFQVKFREIPIAEYQSYPLSHPGQPWNGRMLFMDAKGVNCVHCHRVNGNGGQVGPDLTDLGARQDAAQIIESVLYPSKLILDGYQQVIFRMRDGDTASGIVRGETADTVTLIDTLGETNVLQKSNIQSRLISQVSLMPDGLQSGLSLEQFADLIAYVQNPHLAEASVQAQYGRAKESAEELRKSLAAHYDAGVAMQLGVELTAAGEIKEAIGQYHTLLRTSPDNAEALNNLAWLLAAGSQPELRNGAEAVQLANHACDLTHDRKPLFIGTEAAAYAEAGRFDDAVAAAQKAHDVAILMGLTKIADRNLQLMEMYRSHRAYHEGQ